MRYNSKKKNVSQNNAKLIKMKRQAFKKTSITRNESVEGELLTDKIERIMNNGDPITDGAPIIFTERKDGVLPSFNPRTDRWDAAIDAMDAVSRSNAAKREESMKKRDGMKIIKNEQKVGEPKPTQGTDG